MIFWGGGCFCVCSILEDDQPNESMAIRKIYNHSFFFRIKDWFHQPIKREMKREDELGSRFTKQDSNDDIEKRKRQRVSEGDLLFQWLVCLSSSPQWMGILQVEVSKAWFPLEVLGSDEATDREAEVWVASSVSWHSGLRLDWRWMGCDELWGRATELRSRVWMAVGLDGWWWVEVIW